MKVSPFSLAVIVAAVAPTAFASASGDSDASAALLRGTGTLKRLLKKEEKQKKDPPAQAKVPELPPAAVDNANGKGGPLTANSCPGGWEVGEKYCRTDYPDYWLIFNDCPTNPEYFGGTIGEDNFGCYFFVEEIITEKQVDFNDGYDFQLAVNDDGTLTRSGSGSPKIYSTGAC